MAPEAWPSLEEVEAQVKATTLDQHKEEIKLVENFLNCYLAGFNKMDRFTPTEDNDLKFAWLLLTIRSFNSLRCAYELLQKGYYNQAATLIRAAEEDYLTCRYCEVDESAVKALLQGKGELGKGKFTFTNMAKAISEDFYKNWQTNYGLLSELAHPRQLAMGMVVDWQSNKLTLGADYNENHFVATSQVLLINAIAMIGFLIKLLGENALQWQKESFSAFQEACAYVEKVSEEAKIAVEKEK